MSTKNTKFRNFCIWVIFYFTVGGILNFLPAFVMHWAWKLALTRIYNAIYVADPARNKFLTGMLWALAVLVSAIAGAILLAVSKWLAFYAAKLSLRIFG